MCLVVITGKNEMKRFACMRRKKNREAKTEICRIYLYIDIVHCQNTRRAEPEKQILSLFFLRLSRC